MKLIKETVKFDFDTLRPRGQMADYERAVYKYITLRLGQTSGFKKMMELIKAKAEQELPDYIAGGQVLETISPIVKQAFMDLVDGAVADEFNLMA